MSLKGFASMCAAFLLSLQVSSVLAQCPCPCQKAPEVWSPPVRLKILTIGYGAYAPSVTASGDTICLVTGWGIYRSTGADTVWMIPTILNSNINRTPYVDAPSLSRDGKKLYFRDYGGGYGGWDLWVSEWSDSSNDWGPAKNLGPNVNTDSSDDWWAFTPDNKSLYFDRAIGTSEMLMLSKWDNVSNGWGAPVMLEPLFVGDTPVFNCYGAMNGFTMTGNQKKAYFSVRTLSGAHVEYDLYVMYYDSVSGKWGNPMELNINSHPADSIPWYNPAELGRDEYPSITADGKWLFFDSNRAPDSMFSIYVSHLVIDENGDSVVYTGIKPKEIEQTPKAPQLYQNYPNPFNSSTIISFTLPNRSEVRIEIFDILGRRIKTLLDQSMGVGVHKVSWDGKDQQNRDVSSGAYFCTILVNGFFLREKVVMIR